jgi:hypothetical protein
MSEMTQMAIAHIYGMNHQKQLFREMLETEQKRTGLGFIQYKRILELMEQPAPKVEDEEHPPKRFRDIANGE